jgi:hypothetical protein
MLPNNEKLPLPHGDSQTPPSTATSVGTSVAGSDSDPERGEKAPPSPLAVNFLRSVTIQDKEPITPQNMLRRQTSVGLGPQRADGPSRVIGEFR